MDGKNFNVLLKVNCYIHILYTSVYLGNSYIVYCEWMNKRETPGCHSHLTDAVWAMSQSQLITDKLADYLPEEGNPKEKL